MSEGINTETAILLPTATVDIFVRDQETAQAARALVDDWRFARVTISVEEGDVETAIQSYQQAASPSLIIIETDTTDDSFTERLGTLSEHCSEGTNAVIVGPVNDVNLYRNLTSMGVSDYLVRPVPQDILGEVIAKILIEQLGASGSRLIGVIGAKGGVGTTSIAQAMALGLSQNLGQKSFLMDLAGGWSTMTVGMGFDPLAKLSEATRAASNNDMDSLKRMLFDSNDKLSVLATGSDPMLEFINEPHDVEHMINFIMQSYPVVVVDLSSTTQNLKKMVLSKAHEILMVSTPTLTSLRSARTLMQEIKTLQGGALNGLELVINMQGFFPSKEVPKSDIAAALEREPSAVLPYEPKLFFGAESEGKKVTDMKGGEQIVDSLMPLASKIVKSKKEDDGEKSDDQGILGSVLSKLKAKS